jgi:hypothetical protein
VHPREAREVRRGLRFHAHQVQHHLLMQCVDVLKMSCGFRQ